MQSSDVGVTDHSLRLRAKEILGTPETGETATLVARLFQNDDVQEREAANFEYRFCYVNFPNCLTLKLLKVYGCSLYGRDVRSQSISLLHAVLTYLDGVGFTFSPIALRDIKPALISCLTLQEISETDFKILSRIVYHLASEVFLAGDNAGWPELGEYICTVADHDTNKAIYVFRNLPRVLDDKFLLQVLDKVFPPIMTRLDLRHGSLKDWILGLEAGFNMAVQLLDSTRIDLAGNILHAILSSASELVREEMEDTLREGLEGLVMMLREEAEKYYEKEYKFVLNLLNKIWAMQGISQETKMVVQKAHDILQERCTESS